jgi:hypothetical protein
MKQPVERRLAPSQMEHVEAALAALGLRLIVDVARAA